MHPTITKEDLIRHAYGETSAEENQLISLALESNQELREFSVFLKLTTDALNSISMKPHPTSVQIIMEESQDSSMEIST
jgi:hypothetical protein